MVSNCRTNVVDKLKQEISLYDPSSVLIGSYDRDTLPRYLSKGDVDVMVVMHFSDNKNWYSAEGTSLALQKFQRVLSSAYPQTRCSVDRNCVSMHLKEFRLDVVPAFYFTDGSYCIPDTYRKTWLKTQPKEFARLITTINKNMDGCFVPFIKMIKAWNARWTTTRIRSFHLECMLIEAVKAENQKFPYDLMANYFFEKLPTYLANAAFDPISGDRLDQYLDSGAPSTYRQILIRRAEAVAKSAHEAYETGHFMDGWYTKTAIDQWKKIFGEFFPAYG